MKHVFIFLLATLVSSCFCLHAQTTTFDRVYQIIQTRCTPTCHKASNPTGNLLMDGTKQEVFDNLVNVTPDNSVAAGKGYKRIFPGDSRKSFLFQKINRGLDDLVGLETGEGDEMPQGMPALSKVEREMIRQWIIFGAEDVDYEFANEQTITDYYNGFAEQKDLSLPIPNPNDGRQIYFGPIFLRPNQEVEFDGKFEVNNPFDAEIYRMNASVNKESHHLAMFKFHSRNDTLIKPGLKPVLNLGDAAALFFAADVVGQWPNSVEVELPQGTALLWEKESVLSLSYHLLNFSDSIITAEFYLNLEFRPQDPNTTAMISDPVRYDGHPQYQGGDDVQNLVILPTNTDTTFVINQYHADSTFFWNIWSIQAHTHQIAKAYNIYLRNDDGTKGNLLYDGTKDQECRFQTGFYDWQHPPLCVYEPLVSVDMTKGLIHEATYNNNTGDTVGFGLKTTDEMFVSYIFFFKSESPVSVTPSKILEKQIVNVYPNPSNRILNFELQGSLQYKNATLKIFDVLGRTVQTATLLASKEQIDISNLPAGSYSYQIINDGKTNIMGRVLIE